MNIEFINFSGKEIDQETINLTPKPITYEELYKFIETQYNLLKNDLFKNNEKVKELNFAMLLYGSFNFYTQLIEIDLLPRKYGDYSLHNNYEFLYHFKIIDFLSKHNGIDYTIKRIGNNLKISNLPKSKLITIDEMKDLVVDDNTHFIKGQKIKNNEWYYLRDKILYCLPLSEYAHCENLSFNINTKKFTYSYNIDKSAAGKGWRKLEIYNGEIEPFDNFKNNCNLVETEKCKWD